MNGIQSPNSIALNVPKQQFQEDLPASPMAQLASPSSGNTPAIPTSVIVPKVVDVGAETATTRGPLGHGEVEHESAFGVGPRTPMFTPSSGSASDPVSPLRVSTATAATPSQHDENLLLRSQLEQCKKQYANLKEKTREYVEKLKKEKAKYEDEIRSLKEKCNGALEWELRAHKAEQQAASAIAARHALEDLKLKEQDAEAQSGDRKAVQREIKGLKHQIEELMEEKIRSDRRIAELNEATARTPTSEKMKSKEMELEILKDVVEKQRKSMIERQNEKRELHHQLESASAALVNLRESVRRKENVIQCLEEKTYSYIMESLETSAAAAAADGKSGQSNATISLAPPELKSRIDSLYARNKDLSKENAEVKELLSKARAAIEKLKASNIHSKEEAASSRGAAGDEGSDSKLEKAESDSADDRARQKEMGMQQRALDGEMSALKQQQGLVEQERAELAKEREEVEGEREKLKSSRSCHEVEVQQLREETEALQKLKAAYEHKMANVPTQEELLKMQEQQTMVQSTLRSQLEEAEAARDEMKSKWEKETAEVVSAQTLCKHLKRTLLVDVFIRRYLHPKLIVPHWKKWCGHGLRQQIDDDDSDRSNYAACDAGAAENPRATVSCSPTTLLGVRVISALCDRSALRNFLRRWSNWTEIVRSTDALSDQLREIHSILRRHTTQDTSSDCSLNDRGEDTYITPETLHEDVSRFCDGIANEKRMLKDKMEELQSVMSTLQRATRSDAEGTSNNATDEIGDEVETAPITSEPFNAMLDNTTRHSEGDVATLGEGDTFGFRLEESTQTEAEYDADAAEKTIMRLEAEKDKLKGLVRKVAFEDWSVGMSVESAVRQLGFMMCDVENGELSVDGEERRLNSSRMLSGHEAGDITTETTPLVKREVDFSDVSEFGDDELPIPEDGLRTPSPSFLSQCFGCGSGRHR